jgi:hypothetical protein
MTCCIHCMNFFKDTLGFRIRYEICDLCSEHDADVDYREVGYRTGVGMFEP